MIGLRPGGRAEALDGYWYWGRGNNMTAPIRKEGSEVELAHRCCLVTQYTVHSTHTTHYTLCRWMPTNPRPLWLLTAAGGNTHERALADRRLAF